MSNQIYYKKNFSRGYLSATINAGATSLTVVGGTNKLPTVSTPFYAVIWDYLAYPAPEDDPNVEIVIATWSSGNTYNILRGQDGTTAASHNAGNKVSLNYTAGLSNNDLFVLGSKVFADNGAPNPGYYVWFNGATNQYEMHLGTGSSTVLPFGLFSNRPASPIVGDSYIAVDIPALYFCYSAGVWTSHPGAVAGALLTNLPSIVSGAGLIPVANIPRNIQIFTNVGSNTFIVPPTITEVLITQCGGGGGAGGSARFSSAGGAGAYTMVNVPYTVTPGASISVVIGAGGTGGTAGFNGSYNGGDGGQGGTTSFGSLSIVGGNGGQGANMNGAYTAVGGTVTTVHNGASSSGGGAGGSYAGILGGTGGNGESSYSGGNPGGGGGGSLFGTGGSSGIPGGNGVGYGSGGGGTIGNGSSLAYVGGAGAPGICIVMW